MNKQNYRGYFFGNMYLSSLQQGLQAAHVIQEMHTTMRERDDMASEIFQEWCENDKTIILLNGGSHSKLQDLAIKLATLTHQGTALPFNYYEEEQSALNGVMTSVGIVIPEFIYGYDLMGSLFDQTPALNGYDLEIYNIIRSYRLAR